MRDLLREMGATIRRSAGVDGAYRLMAGGARAWADELVRTREEQERLNKMTGKMQAVTATEAMEQRLLAAAQKNPEIAARIRAMAGQTSSHGRGRALTGVLRHLGPELIGGPMFPRMLTGGGANQMIERVAKQLENIERRRAQTEERREQIIGPMRYIVERGGFNKNMRAGARLWLEHVRKGLVAANKESANAYMKVFDEEMSKRQDKIRRAEQRIGDAQEAIRQKFAQTFGEMLPQSGRTFRTPGRYRLSNIEEVRKGKKPKYEWEKGRTHEMPGVQARFERLMEAQSTLRDVQFLHRQRGFLGHVERTRAEKAGRTIMALGGEFYQKPELLMEPRRTAEEKAEAAAIEQKKILETSRDHLESIRKDIDAIRKKEGGTIAA
jgi:hypothetical protein